MPASLLAISCASPLRSSPAKLRRGTQDVGLTGGLLSTYDGLTVAQTGEYLKTHWPRIREALLDGSYRPEPVRRVQIPKPGGGVRELGIPTVTA